jgi:hypothetical protein
MRRSVRARLLGPTTVGLALLGSATPARSADPRVAFRVPRAPDRAPAVSSRLDARGTGRSSVRLPSTPLLGFHARVVPPIIGQVVADGSGRALVAHGGDRVSAVDATGHVAWSVRVGTELAAGPLLVGGRRVLALASDGRLFDISPTAGARLLETLPWNQIEGDVLHAPTADGGALLANGARLAKVGASGVLDFHARLADPVRAVFEWQGLALAIALDGSVWARATSGDPREIGSLGEPVRQALLVGDRVLGLADHGLVAFELPGRRQRVLWTDPILPLRDLAAVSDERLRLVGGRSTLVDVGGDGRELARFALPTGEGGPELTSVIVDAGGSAVVLANGAPLVAVTSQGDATLIAGTGCPDALRPTPVAEGRLIAACRSGVLRGVSDKGP